MKKKLLFFVITAAFVNLASAYDLPTIAVPNIVYTKTQKQTTNQDQNSTIANTDQALTQEVQKELPMFSADIKGALINSKQFKVVDTPRGNNLWTGNPQNVLNYVSSVNKSSNHSQSKKHNQSNPESLVANPSNNDLPDYILLGTLSAITFDSDIEPIQNTNKLTDQYNIDISVDYQVVSTKNNAVVASFNAYGHANDVKILNANDTVQRQTHNTPKLIHEASKDLANNVLTQLQQQFSVSSKTYKIESITNLKVYN